MPKDLDTDYIPKVRSTLTCLACMDNRHELCPQRDDLGTVCVCACGDEGL